MFGALMLAHALADYPLQGDFLSKAKNRAAALTHQEKDAQDG